MRGSRLKLKTKQKIIGNIIFLILLTPIALYLLFHGLDISSDHKRWSEFGTYLAGIYTPIVSILTLIVLIQQRKSQNRMDKHMYDTSFIQNAREDLNFYIDRLENALNDPTAGGGTVKEKLTSCFTLMSEEDIHGEQGQQAKEYFRSNHRNIISLWNAMQPILRGLSSVDETPYRLAVNSGVHRVAALISYNTCYSLDVLYYISAESSDFISKENLYFYGK